MQLAKTTWLLFAFNDRLTPDRLTA